MKLTSFSAVGILVYIYLTKVNSSKNLVLSNFELEKVVQNLFLPPHSLTEKSDLKLIELGQKLFFDPDFSQNKQISCSTCHDPKKDFTDGKKVAEGVTKTSTNAPSILNANLLKWFFFDGRADSLELQALGPLENPKEHGFSRGKLVKVLYQKYKKEFEFLFGTMPEFTELVDYPEFSTGIAVADAVSAFALSTLGDKDFLSFILKKAQSQRVQPITILNALTGIPSSKPSRFDLLPPHKQDQINYWFTRFGIAVAAFERTIHTQKSPFDLFSQNFIKTKDPNLSFVPGFGQKELAGLNIFAGKGGCFQCHHGPLLSDQQFHNVGLASTAKESIELGRTLGILQVKNNPLNCKSKFWPTSILESESCHETDFVDLAESELVGAFKTPTLRNIKNTGPYGHDGRFSSLKEILEFYNNPTAVKPAVGHRAEVLKPLNLSNEELSNLLLFLESLTGEINWGHPTINF